MPRKDPRTAANLRKDPATHTAYLDRKKRERAARKERETERKRKWRIANPDKAQRLRQANHAVENALINGQLTRPKNCSKCGTQAEVEGHHWSYAKEHWLDVIWLCQNCHSLEHHAK